MPENYNYNKFLSDSSDDYPKYGDNLNNSPITSQGFKDWRAERKYLQEKWGKSGARVTVEEIQKKIMRVKLNSSDFRYFRTSEGSL